MENGLLAESTKIENATIPFKKLPNQKPTLRQIE